MIDIATLLNQGLTVSMLTLMLWLFREWWPGVKQTALTFWRERTVTGTGLLMWGIYVGAAASFADNGYWLIAWSLRYLGSPLSDAMIDNGIFANTVFRQLWGIAAYVLHLMAVWKNDEAAALRGRHILKACIISGGVFTIVLFAIGLFTR